MSDLESLHPSVSVDGSRFTSSESDDLRKHRPSARRRTSTEFDRESRLRSRFRVLLREIRIEGGSVEGGDGGGSLGVGIRRSEGGFDEEDAGLAAETGEFDDVDGLRDGVEFGEGVEGELGILRSRRIFSSSDDETQELDSFRLQLRLDGDSSLSDVEEGENDEDEEGIRRSLLDERFEEIQNSKAIMQIVRTLRYESRRQYRARIAKRIDKPFFPFFPPPCKRKISASFSSIAII